MSILNMTGTVPTFVSAAVWEGKVYVPFFSLELTVTRIISLDMLQSWLVLQLQDDTPSFIYQQDGAPPHHRLAWGWWRLEFCLVLMLCISEFTWKRFLLSTTNSKRECIYWDCNGRILKCLNSSLQESLGLDPVMILTASFWSQKIWELYEELPQKIIP